MVSDNAVLPLKLFSEQFSQSSYFHPIYSPIENRTQVGTCLSACFVMFTMMGAIYYREHDTPLIFLARRFILSPTVPLLFQAVKHHSATKSGIDMYGVHFWQI